MNFLGYERPNGNAGIRNHVLILPTCACSSETARIISSQVLGTVNVINQNGCAQVKGDLKITMDILSGLAANLKVYGSFDAEKKEVPISELVVATNCGGSDPTSGLASNPVLGNASDRLVDLGSTSILCETTEFIGAEHILADRAASPEVRKIPWM